MYILLQQLNIDVWYVSFKNNLIIVLINICYVPVFEELLIVIYIHVIYYY